MTSPRALGRLIGFLCWSGACWLLAMLNQLLGRLAPRPRARLYVALCRAWARGVARLIGLRISVRGTPPRPPFVLVANHLGYLDIITLMAHSPGVFVSRGDLSGWPVLGALAKAADTIFIDRALRGDVVRANMLIGSVLHGGRGLLMFPEGTSSSGEQVLPFRSSLLQPAVALGRPVSWACLRYTTPAGQPPASRSVCWWGDMTFLDHFWHLLKLPHIDAELRFGEQPLAGSDRHQLAHRLEAEVHAGLGLTGAPETRVLQATAPDATVSETTAPDANTDSLPNQQPLASRARASQAPA